MKLSYYIIFLAIWMGGAQVLDYFGILCRQQLVLENEEIPFYTVVESQAQENAMQEAAKDSLVLELATMQRSSYDTQAIDIRDAAVEILGEFDFQCQGVKKLLITYQDVEISYAYYVGAAQPYVVSSYQDLQDASGYDYILIAADITIPQGDSLYLGQFCRLDIAEGCTFTLNGEIDVGNTLYVQGDIVTQTGGKVDGYLQNIA